MLGIGLALTSLPANSGGGQPALLNGANAAIPLLYTVVPTRGSLTPSFTRATTETGQKYDSAGYLDFTALSGEVIFKGAMRIYNEVSTKSADNTVGSTISANVTAATTTLTMTAANGSYWYKNSNGNAAIGRVYQCSADVSSTVARTLCLRALATSGTNSDVQNVAVTSTVQRVNLKFTADIVGVVLFGIENRAAYATDTGTTGVITFTNVSINDITGETDQTTLRPYVSVGVTSAPAYHGSMLDGIKAFPYDRSGNPIPRTGSYPLVGYVPWEARTNHFLNSGAPATHTSGSLGTGTYTLWMTGTGSIAVAGTTATITGAGTAIAGTPVTFVVTVAGTVTYTVTGSPTKAQSENGAFPTPYIITAGAPVPRNADVEAETTSGVILAAGGTIALTYIPYHAPSGTIFLWGTYVDASNYTAILHDATNLIFRKRIAGTNYDATIANTFVSGTTYKMAATWGAGGSTICLNGVAGTPHANTTAAQIAATMQFGADGNSLQQPGAAVINNYIWQRQLSASEQTAVTA